jgi:hypothetical protein
MMFHTPVTTSTANAVQATWPKPRAAARRTSGAEPAQHRGQGRQGQLAAHPDGGGEHMQEQPDYVPADGEHPGGHPSCPGRDGRRTAHRISPDTGATAGQPARCGQPEPGTVRAHRHPDGVKGTR